MNGNHKQEAVLIFLLRRFVSNYQNEFKLITITSCGKGSKMFVPLIYFHSLESYPYSLDT